MALRNSSGRRGGDALWGQGQDVSGKTQPLPRSGLRDAARIRGREPRLPTLVVSLPYRRDANVAFSMVRTAATPACLAHSYTQGSCPPYCGDYMVRGLWVWVSLRFLASVPARGNWYHLDWYWCLIRDSEWPLW